jgi:hypothetical protein
MGQVSVDNPELDAYRASARQQYKCRKDEEQAKVDAGVASELDLVLRGKPYSASVLRYADGRLAELRDVLLAYEERAERQRAASRWLEEDGLDEDTKRERWKAYELVMDSRDSYREAIRSRKRADEFFRKAGGVPSLNVREDEDSHAELPRYSPQTFITTLSRHHENGRTVEYTSLCPMTRDWRIDPGSYLKRVMREVWKVREEVEEHGNFRLSYFSAGDWLKTAERWKKRRQRDSEDVRFMKYPLADGRLAVIHNADDGTGELVPATEAELKELLFPLMDTPEGKRPSGSRGFGGRYEGMRGDGRKRQAKREGVETEVVGQFVTSGAGGLVRAAEVLDVQLNSRLRGKRELDHEDAILSMLDAGFRLKPRDVHHEGLVGLLEAFVLADEETHESECVPYNAHSEESPLSVRYTGQDFAESPSQLVLNVRETAEEPADIYFGGGR